MAAKPIAAKPTAEPATKLATKGEEATKGDATIGAHFSVMRGGEA